LIQSEPSWRRLRCGLCAIRPAPAAAPHAIDLPMADKSHWDCVYADRADDALSWFQQHPRRSLALIAASGVGSDAAIIDVGGGASHLTADLLSEGFADLWVLDISATALAASRTRLGAYADRVHWIEADVTQVDLPPARFDIWHDRAVFHFLTEPADCAAYAAAALCAVKPGGHLIIATFAEDGPEQCSGLPVARYDAASLASQFGDGCSLVHTAKEAHLTPAGKEQQFRYCLLRRHTL
jgi:ubiquinone/menaquinone biosynthesis C-methylase UbiE